MRWLCWVSEGSFEELFVRLPHAELHRIEAVPEANAEDVSFVLDAQAAAEGDISVIRERFPYASVLWVRNAEDTTPPGVDDHVDRLDFGGLSRAIRYGQERALARRHLAEMTHQAARWGLRDPLTDLLNRRGLEQALLREIAVCERGAGSMSALLVDCDDFKRVNDVHGHAAGDALLRQISEMIGTTVRAGDYVARIGGDEFMVLLPSTRPVEAQDVAERIRQRVRGLAERQPDHVAPTVSIGVHRVPSSTRKVTDLVRATQAALKVSKTGGKDRVSVSPDSGVPAVQSLEYKEPRPLVRLSDREVIGWDPGTTEPVDPSQKLRRTLRRAAMPEYDLVRIERLAAAAPLDAGRVLLPVLPSTLVRLPVSELIAQLPDRVAPENVTLVLDEECLFGAPSGLVPPVAALRERGVSVMMHVRGFGVTCLESLVLLRPSWVRIDAERVRGAANRVAVRAVLARFIAVCDALDIEVVVAGIATEKDLQALSGLGVDYGQGPLLG